MAKKRLTMCAGEFIWPIYIDPIVRPYFSQDRVWPHEPGVTVFGETPSMFPYKKYVPQLVNGGEA
jgi:hypothetical protein